MTILNKFLSIVCTWHVYTGALSTCPIKVGQKPAGFWPCGQGNGDIMGNCNDGVIVMAVMVIIVM